MVAATETFTELLRRPRDVVALTDDGPVHVTRRDADDLILMRADDLYQQEKGIALASALLRATLGADGDLTAAVNTLYPWFALLSKAEQKECVGDVSKHLWSATELGVYGALLNYVSGWRDTAEGYAGSKTAPADISWNHTTVAEAAPKGARRTRKEPRPAP
ncbi:hypothetical protein GII33_01060 [Gordonia pseudamarae]|jgi:hypothetical protein|uniref:Type II toxin-antitoxin system Phd/YefM family antitoxin n=1 Tax=Gordonia pseudamarae TaxID=2831662 RepID=A0ABX6ICN5_9ACTN|nr:MULTISPECIES: hypothetical protein [Gordonia]MBD0024006.1 hypothetical protein [Gordonia sp. (in: high G+C Gram-positive bacteria)]QHN24769.1 hypothetical protein GII33_01060 [Gordonia pseudamarae]QHN33702.1 hypothetical protein GII31_01060 [Gordonia pseudamarae]